ncbi:prepilin-type N-terminal cleavage/methylation domain-containing protein [Aquimarina sp. 2201CG1-2-11]|uniref:PulJ/GspJ family protein n=1 Tax=Aquimarina discodermiae TaxID=3231043 RepID=UPI0034634A2F
MKFVTKKIKAFTLTEMMIVIVISAIVATLAFSVLNIVQNNMRSIEVNYSYKEQIQSLETALTIDFNKYTDAVWDPVENTLTVSSPIQEQQYRFLTDSIVNTINTYQLSIKEKQFYFEGKSVNEGTIDAIKLTFHNTRASHRLFVYKHNDPTVHF